MKHKIYIILLGVLSLFTLCFFPIYEMVLAKQFDIARIIAIALAVLLITGMMYDKLVWEKRQ